ncbi:SDR family NAD(P)-dependent oxidoreductase [Kaistella flava (ex Peng et al. 2021)]|uniref:SDR family NAD(P)-dependent oxidoreductase n=1 Tax=Kaistella flava (ex Peng et al. 2021) TaxID=2038776 RepID=A0A7M2Y4Y3_9FLAO|nr:SDR family NAD(P)-dependent oxidoreductase [Kaistella flava (ex Peng et al. 2021)]QOW09231.1 SDR family NAD(P)-dependent oxidoreductase [Kaistella flava (ex Peng et al. 2021)]
MKNILITGGAGFIGSNVALKLISQGYSVTVLDNLSEQIHGSNPENSALYQSILGKVNFIKGDITNRKDVEKVIEGQDAIIHLAAETGTGQSMYSLEKYNQVNVSGTALLLDILVNQKNSVKKIILASSRAVYGEGKYQNPQSESVYPKSRLVEVMQEGHFEMTDENCQLLKPLATDENSKLHPTSFYGLTKLQQEQMVKLVCESIGINYVILRYQNVFGVGQSLLNPYTGILSIFSTQILNGNALNIFEDGLMTRDFINIEDTVDATIKSLELETANNEIINIGTGVATDVLSVANLLVKAYEKDVPIEVSGDFRVGDIRHNFADLTKAKQLLDFQPKVSFEKGIQEFTNWVLQQPRIDNNLEQSLQEMKEKGFLKS